MIKFEKVSYDVFSESLKAVYAPAIISDEIVKAVYEAIKLPQRATSGSAGYDFFSPVKFKLAPGKGIVIPTGIRCFMNKENVLQIYPRSGQGFKTGVRLANTVGIIDSDYSDSDNEGHIMVKLINESSLNKTLEVEAGGAFCQGMITTYCVTDDDQVTDKRNGGFGSTKK